MEIQVSEWKGRKQKEGRDIKKEDGLKVKRKTRIKKEWEYKEQKK